ncbi:MAG: hypothetical protein U9N72_08185, partial [Bacteroidota bacterium]|nr:hypothetical protein [Bacteroidota bacterium]
MKISKYILLLVILFSSTLSFSVSPAPERVFVHTDRNIYVAGEDILYSFYLINDESRDSSKISTIGYLELISSNDVAVTQTRLSINKSYGHGILSIPDSLTTGVYMLRGYIRSMRNYGPDIFFTRYLTIYNPFKETIKYSQQDTVGIIDDDVYINREVNLKNIAGLKSDFGTREKVTMKLQLDSSSFSNPDMCNISVAVAVSRDNTDSDNITDFITAKNIPAGTVSGDHSNNVMRETIGPYLEGSVISRASLQPVKDKRLYLSVPGKNTYLRYSDTDENGNFIFLFPPYKGKRDFIIQSADFSDDLIIKTLSPFANMHDVDQ